MSDAALNAAPWPWHEAPLAQALQLRAHALLIWGDEGRGLYPLAMRLAHTLLCSRADPARRPCGVCEDCQLLKAQTHPDLAVLMPEALREGLQWRVSHDDEAARDKAKKPSADIRVDEVRQAIEWGTRSVSRGALKVLIVHPATSMNTVAANALLKTLEEPPGALKIILTAKSAADLLPTLASRCQQVAVPPVNDAVALRWLAEQGVRADATALLKAAGGEPLGALRLHQQGLTATHWHSIPAAVASGQSSVFAGWTLPDVVVTLQKLCHDSMAQASGAVPRYFDAASLHHQASWDALGRWSQDLFSVARTAEHPWQLSLAVDAAVLRAAQALSQR